MINSNKMTKAVLSRLVGFAIFILIWLTMNFLTRYITDVTYNSIILFFNQNFVLLLVMSLLFLFGELLSFVPFPLDLPAPLFNAGASYFLVGFIFDVFRFVDAQFGIGALYEFLTFESLVKIIVILVVIIVGYVKLFSMVFSKSQRDDFVEDEKEDSDEDESKDADYSEDEDDNEEQKAPKRRTKRKRK